MTIERRQVSDQVVFLVSGRMDAENAPQFEEQCRACIAEGLTVVVVDLGGLAYVSSMGLRSFVSLAKTLQDKGGALRICRLHGLVKQVFEITGLSRSYSAPVYRSKSRLRRAASWPLTSGNSNGARIVSFSWKKLTE